MLAHAPLLALNFFGTKAIIAYIVIIVIIAAVAYFTMSNRAAPGR